MIDTDDFIDLSLIKAQNELAVNIADLLTIEELRTVDICNVEKKTRSIDEIESVYYTKDFGDGKILRIIDTLILDAFPTVRYVCIKISIKNKMRTSFTCKYSKAILKYLALTFGKAYNYKRWKYEEDTKYIKSHILNTFSKILSIQTEKFLEDLKFIIQYLIDDESITNNNNYHYDFSIEKIDFNIESNNLGVIKFSYKRNIDAYWDSIYVTKNNVGLANIMLIINQALALCVNKQK